MKAAAADESLNDAAAQAAAVRVQAMQRGKLARKEVATKKIQYATVE